jgi:Cdc6-like AAA superfamily ATPase
VNQPNPRSEPRDRSRNRPSNPFPKVPEVRLGGTGVSVHVETDAVRRVRRLAVDFLTSRPDLRGDPGTTGRVAAVLGEYGTGKSHLAWTLLDELARSAAARPVMLVVSGQPRDTVLTLHRRLLAPPGSGAGGQIQPVDTAAGVLLFGAVEKMVEDLYAGLRHGSGIDPDAPPPTASDELPVDETHRLHERLTAIAEGDAELATVLRLVWHTAVGAAAWRWLCGAEHRPDEDARLLADRGVHTPPVDRDDRALRVLRALARLCAWTGGRMVFVLDELHQISPRGGDGLTEVAATLMELTGWATETGALLAVCGLLDFWEALPDSIRQRVTTRIVPSGLTTEQITAYVAAAVHPGGDGEGDPHPFTEEAVHELWKITDGHPRRTITLCHHAYERRSAAGLIGPRQIRDASRSLCAPDTPEHVRTKLFGRCIELGYHVERVRRAESHWEPDLRIRSRRGDGECALVVSGPVVSDAELEALRRRAGVLARNRADARDVVLVMAGQLAAAFGDEVEHAFTRVLHWDADTFHDDLAATLHSHISAGDGQAMYELLFDMRREIAALRTPPPPPPPPAVTAAVERTWTDPDRRGRFEAADRHCLQALQVIAIADARVQEFWQSRFQPEARGIEMPRAEAPGDRYAAIGDFVGSSTLKARGALAFLHDIVRAFMSQLGDMLVDEAVPLAQIRTDLRLLSDRVDHAVDAVIRGYPREHDDPGNTVGRLLGVDRRMLDQHLRGLGTTVYSVVVAPAPREGRSG